jgi:transposase
MVAASARVAIGFSLSAGNVHDAPEGQALLQQIGTPSQPLKLIMDKAYEANAMRQLALDLGYEPVVPPKSNRLNPWTYDRKVYARRNEIERLFRRLKGFRRIFSRFDKLDILFIGFIHFALIVDCLNSVNTP